MISTILVATVLIMAWTTLSLRPEDELYKRTGTNIFLINTTGCFIPNYGTTVKFWEPMTSPKRCGPRLIFVTVLNPYKLLVKTNTAMMQPIYRKKLNCCYKFASVIQKAAKKKPVINYSKCERLPAKNTTTIPFKTEHLKVTCQAYKTTIYEDLYVLLKEKKPAKKVTNSNKKNPQNYNVLIIGIDTMSRARAFRLMPQTVNYLLSKGWIDYKGYNKVGANTFPNVMSLLTGKKMCNDLEVRNVCKHLILWRKFKDSGYVTAYGEDMLKLPDTFVRYKGFPMQPTDHYMRPFFLLGEKDIGNSVCCGKVASGIHVLNYAADFAKTYRNRKMFGFFWINSFGHNFINKPSLFDLETLNFFKNLSNDTLENTFILFLSDHGIRYFKACGEETYYEERLPLNFIWVPFKFRVKQLSFYQNLVKNQHRLTTPFDVYMTLQDILKMSNNSVKIVKSDSCPRCSSLFKEKSSKRTCAEAAVDEEWCCCHKFNYPRYKFRNKTAYYSCPASLYSRLKKNYRTNGATMS